MPAKGGMPPRDLLVHVLYGQVTLATVAREAKKVPVTIECNQGLVALDTVMAAGTL